MPNNYWLVKQEPDDYDWSALVRDGGTAWTGIRNFQARNHLRAMRTGDLVLFYHSGSEKRVAGLGRVAREAYADPTAAEGDWSAVDLEPVAPLPEAVPLEVIKAEPRLQALALIRQPRLSVVPLTAVEFRRLLAMGGMRGLPR